MASPGLHEVARRHKNNPIRNDEGQRSQLGPTSLALPRLHAVALQPTECSMSSYPVHRPRPPTRRYTYDGDIVPKEAWIKLASHTLFTLDLRVVSEGSSMPAWERTTRAEMPRILAANLPRHPDG